MRRIGIAALITGAGVVLARKLAPRLHERMMAGCERMFEQMPDDFPPKRMLRGIEETRSNTARLLELSEAGKGAGESEPLAENASTKTMGHAA